MFVCGCDNELFPPNKSLSATRHVELRGGEWPLGLRERLVSFPILWSRERLRIIDTPLAFGCILPTTVDDVGAG